MVVTILFDTIGVSYIEKPTIMFSFKLYNYVEPVGDQTIDIL